MLKFEETISNILKRKILWLKNLSVPFAVMFTKVMPLLRNVLYAKFLQRNSRKLLRMKAESGACADKKRIATKAKQLNLDAIHDTVHEMCKDEARHGQVFEGLYKRFFEK